MSRFRCLPLSIAVLACAAQCGQQAGLGLGRTPTAAQSEQSTGAVLPDGAGLPVGSGTAVKGQNIFKAKCATCHGVDGSGNEPFGPSLVGGQGTLKSESPVLTVGSYWPYATTIWDYIHRAMPYAQPGSLSASETYAVTAFLLYRNGIIGRDEMMNQETLPKVRMPNQDGFVPDPRPDTTCRAR